MIATDRTTDHAGGDALRVRATTRTLGASAAVIWLHHLGARPWARLPRVSSVPEALDVLASDPGDAVMAVLRLVGLGLGLWIAGVGALAGAAATLRSRSLHPRTVRPPLARARRAAEALTVGTVTGGLLTWSTVASTATGSARPPDVTPAAAAATAPGGPPAPPGVVPPAGSRPRTGGAADPGAAVPARPARSPGAVPGLRPPGPADPTRWHVVRRGESLWTIAAVRGGRDGTGGRRPAARRSVARRWRRLIRLNRNRLRSGEPDRILPGERLRLP